jgi:hypothetical protein
MRARVAGVSRFLAVSSAVARRNGLLGGPVRCDVIPNFIPDELLDPIERLAAPHSGGGPSVFVGDLTPDKGGPTRRCPMRPSWCSPGAWGQCRSTFLAALACCPSWPTARWST